VPNTGIRVITSRHLERMEQVMRDVCFGLTWATTSGTAPRRPASNASSVASQRAASRHITATPRAGWLGG